MIQIIKKLFWHLYRFIPYALTILFAIIVYYYISISLDKNYNYYTSIISGIISGVVTALILFVFQVLWKKNIQTWIENLLYQDVCIEGEWHGFLVPFLGLEDLDKIYKEMAWRRFKELLKKGKLQPQEKKRADAEDATVIDEKTETGEKVSAEVVLQETKKTESDNKGEKKILVNLEPTPIIVRVEMKRIGHKISGRIIEIGGASNICSYSISGTFKNLILSGCYETTSKDNIDRGALSLMLLENGKKLEGFFSSYSDGGHRIVPMQCILKKKNQLNEPHNED